jgi:hypothetical protein
MVHMVQRLEVTRHSFLWGFSTVALGSRGHSSAAGRRNTFAFTMTRSTVRPIQLQRRDARNVDRPTSAVATEWCDGPQSRKLSTRHWD